MPTIPPPSGWLPAFNPISMGKSPAGPPEAQAGCPIPQRSEDSGEPDKRSASVPGERTTGGLHTYAYGGMSARFGRQRPTDAHSAAAAATARNCLPPPNNMGGKYPLGAIRQGKISNPLWISRGERPAHKSTNPQGHKPTSGRVSKLIGHKRRSPLDGGLEGCEDRAMCYSD